MPEVHTNGEAVYEQEDGLSDLITRLTAVFKSEADAIPTIRERVTDGSTVHADEGSAWDHLHAVYETKRVNHSVTFKDVDACTNQAESYFSRLRRAEFGTHHRISGAYLYQYADEMAWREDMRRVSNGDQYVMVVAAAMAHPVSRVWKGYWQRTTH